MNVTLSGGTFGDDSDHVTYELGAVSVGQLIVVGASMYTGGNDPFIEADCIQSAGTATLEAFTLDRLDGGDNNGTDASYTFTGIWSARVLVAGDLEVTVQGAWANSWLLNGAIAVSGTWDVAANRRSGAPIGAFDPANDITSMSSGNVTTDGAALLFGALGISNETATAITRDAAFTDIYTEDGEHMNGGFMYRIVGGPTTDAASWTFPALSGGAWNGASASLVAYKEMGASTTKDLAAGAAAAAAAAANAAVAKILGALAHAQATATAAAAAIAKTLGGAAAGQASATGQLLTGTLTTPALKNNTGTLLANEVGATVHVYALGGALVVTKTAQTTNAAGVMTINDAAIAAGTTYRVVVVLASGAEGMDKLVAS